MLGSRRPLRRHRRRGRRRRRRYLSVYLSIRSFPTGFPRVDSPLKRASRRPSFFIYDIGGTELQPSSSTDRPSV